MKNFFYFKICQSYTTQQRRKFDTLSTLLIWYYAKPSWRQNAMVSLTIRLAMSESRLKRIAEDEVGDGMFQLGLIIITTFILHNQTAKLYTWLRRFVGQRPCLIRWFRAVVTGLQNDEDHECQHTPQADDDGPHPAEIALIVVLILFLATMAAFAAAVAFWLYSWVIVDCLVLSSTTH